MTHAFILANINCRRIRPSLNRALLFSSMILLPACSGQTPTESAPAVADSTMIELIIELHLAEARSQVTETDLAAARDSIFLYYGIEHDAYAAAMDYYSRNPDEFVKIYAEALDRLSDERYLPAE